MSAWSRLTTTSVVAQFIDHLRVPLYRNGYALVLSSAATSGLGMVYWILAARSYSTDAIGLNSAAISSILFLANLAQLNLVNALNRFIPTAGRATTRLVVYAYLISVAVALVASLLFIAGASVWAPALNFSQAGPMFMVWFAVATMGWCIFLLQDSVLTGLRQAHWVPIENLVFSVAKIVLLVILAASFPFYGVLASWTLPLALSIVPVNLLIFRRLIPKHIRAAVNQTQTVPVLRSQIAKYVAGDYLSTLVWMASTSLLPLIVLQRAGATANAYFYLCNTLAYSLYLVSQNMGMSLVAEAATDPAQMDRYAYRTFVQTARLVVPGVVVIILGAPLILRLFGANYEAEGTALLRLLSLSAVPYIINAIFVSIARVQRKMMSIFVVLGIMSVLTLGLTIILLDADGAVGIGWAWLISQTVVALIVVITRFRTTWLTQLELGAVLHLLEGPRNLWQRRIDRRYLSQTLNLLPEILPQVTPLPDLASPTEWKMQGIVGTVTDMTVINLGPIGQPSVAMLKLASSEQAITSLRTQEQVLQVLRNNPRLASFAALLPVVLAQGETMGRSFLIERRLSGIDGRLLMSDPVIRRRVQATALAKIRELHQATATPVVVEAELLKSWIDKPMLIVQPTIAAHRQAHELTLELDRLAAELRNGLVGRSVAVSWIHGDFMPGNVLVTADGATVTGIIDWDLAAPHELPQIDVLQFLLATRIYVERRELGDVVRDLLNGSKWYPYEQDLLMEAQSALPGDILDLRTLVLLNWLRHIAANLAKSTGFAHNWLWFAKNVEGLLRSM